MCQSSKTIQPIIKTNQFSYAILLYARNGEQTWLGITKNHKKKKQLVEKNYYGAANYQTQHSFPQKKKE